MRIKLFYLHQIGSIKKGSIEIAMDIKIPKAFLFNEKLYEKLIQK